MFQRKPYDVKQHYALDFVGKYDTNKAETSYTKDNLLAKLN